MVNYVLIISIKSLLIILVACCLTVSVACCYLWGLELDFGYVIETKNMTPNSLSPCLPVASPSLRFGFGEWQLQWLYYPPLVVVQKFVGNHRATWFYASAPLRYVLSFEQYWFSKFNLKIEKLVILSPPFLFLTCKLQLHHHYVVNNFNINYQLLAH